VFSMHKFFSSTDEINMVNLECRRAGIGCVDCKKLLARNINAYFEPFRARRAEISKDVNYVWDVLRQGKERAQIIARQTMAEVRQAVGLP
jgi:tryptophanyl-tRNA synthetase